MDEFKIQKLNSSLQGEAHRKEQAPIKNLMLGEINAETGKYVIPEDITVALTNLIKSLDKKVEDNYFVSSFSSFDEFGKLQFVIATEVSEDGNRKAILYLIEKIEINGGLTETANIYEVNNFVAEANLEFEHKMLKHFKIINTALVREEDIEDEFEEFILYKKFLAKEVKAAIKDKMEIVEADLLAKRLKLLLEYGEFGLDALTVYETLQKKAKEKYKKDKLSARELNELLEAALSYAQKQHREEAERFFAKQKQFIEEYSKKTKEIEKAAIKKAKAAGNAAKKAAGASKKGKKKGGGGKGGGGKGGGGKGGGGGAKKKDDKKVATVPSKPLIVIDKMTSSGGAVRTDYSVQSDADSVEALMEIISKANIILGEIHSSGTRTNMPDTSRANKILGETGSKEKGTSVPGA